MFSNLKPNSHSLFEGLWVRLRHIVEELFVGRLGHQPGWVILTGLVAWRAESGIAVHIRLGVGRARPYDVRLCIPIGLLDQLDVSIVTLAALFEVLCLVSSPG